MKLLNQNNFQGSLDLYVEIKNIYLNSNLNFDQKVQIYKQILILYNELEKKHQNR